jgi:hypothetical protein
LSDLAPLIVSLHLDGKSFSALNALRQLHFPPERNFLDAHLTLFHHLPGGEEAEVKAILAAASQIPPIELEPLEFRSLGRGVAAYYQAPALLALHQSLQKRFSPWLKPQDQQKLRPHITVQNKVLPADAAALLKNLTACFPVPAARGEGLLLSRYLGGPWELIDKFPFCGRGHSEV